MLDFLKNEVSGLKNVLNAYFAFKNHLLLSGDLLPEQMEQFAQWYYSFRLGPPMIPEHKAYLMQQTALSYARQKNYSQYSSMTILDILFGLLQAEDVPFAMEYKTFEKVFIKYPVISIVISGM